MSTIDHHHDCNSYRAFAKLPYPRTCKRCGLGPCTSGIVNKSNNPPAVSLELSGKQAKFLLKNCNSNITFGLASLQGTTSKSSAEALVELMEQFKEIREMLIKQGVTDDEAKVTD